MIHENNLGPPQAAGDDMCWHQVAPASVCLSVRQPVGCHFRMGHMGDRVDCEVKLPRYAVTLEGFGDDDPESTPFYCMLWGVATPCPSLGPVSLLKEKVNS